MKRLICALLAAALGLGLAACGAPDGPAASQAPEGGEGYTIRVYSNSNSDGRAEWLVQAAREAGFSVSMDGGDVISGDDAALQAADRNGDGDILFGLNEARWDQVIRGEYENLSLVEWTPDWAEGVGAYAYPGLAYGLVIQNVLMLCRTDDLGTDGQVPHLAHWADVADSGYTWYRQNKVGGTTNGNINNAILYPYVDPDSPAGGIAVEGWKALWRYCAEGVNTGDAYGFAPLDRGEVQLAAYYSSALYGSIQAEEGRPERPLRGTEDPENWALVDIDDGTYYIAEYLGVLDRAGRTPEETETVLAFARWFGSPEVQAAWGAAFGTYPCNRDAARLLYPDGAPALYTRKDMAQATVADGVTYAQYVAAHREAWDNIMVNLGFFWPEDGPAAPEPDWDSLDWAALTEPGNG